MIVADYTEARYSNRSSHGPRESWSSLAGGMEWNETPRSVPASCELGRY